MKLLRRFTKTKEQWVDGVQGKRSPMWALWSKMTIPCPNGEIYLARIRVVQTPWFGILLHDIYEPDQDRDPHDHPWTFWSFVLRGGYIEQVFEDTGMTEPVLEYGLDSGLKRKVYPSKLFGRSRFSLHRMNTDKAHQITNIQPNTRTLIFCGPRVRKWGFWTPDGWVHWKDYIEYRDGVRP